MSGRLARLVARRIGRVRLFARAAMICHAVTTTRARPPSPTRPSSRDVITSWPLGDIRLRVERRWFIPLPPPPVVDNAITIATATLFPPPARRSRGKHNNIMRDARGLRGALRIVLQHRLDASRDRCAPRPPPFRSWTDRGTAERPEWRPHVSPQYYSLVHLFAVYACTGCAVG